MTFCQGDLGAEYASCELKKFRQRVVELRSRPIHRTVLCRGRMHSPNCPPYAVQQREQLSRYSRTHLQFPQNPRDLAADLGASICGTGSTRCSRRTRRALDRLNAGTANPHQHPTFLRADCLALATATWDPFAYLGQIQNTLASEGALDAVLRA